MAENFGIAFVALVDAIDPDKVAILPISDVASRHTVYMGYLRDKYRIPAVTRFIQFVKNMGKEQPSRPRVSYDLKRETAVGSLSFLFYPSNPFCTNSANSRITGA